MGFPKRFRRSTGGMRSEDFAGMTRKHRLLGIVCGVMAVGIFALVVGSQVFEWDVNGKVFFPYAILFGLAATLAFRVGQLAGMLSDTPPDRGASSGSL